MTQLRMSHPHGYTPPNTYADFDWIRQNRKALLDKYGECSIIVYQTRVIGIGATLGEAVRNAMHNVAQGLFTFQEEEITPVHQWLRHRHPFYRVRPTLKNG